MQEYYDHRGLLLNKYEWAGGLGKSHKEVTKAQASRRKEVKNGSARIISGAEWV